MRLLLARISSVAGGSALLLLMSLGACAEPNLPDEEEDDGLGLPDRSEPFERDAPSATDTSDTSQPIADATADADANAAGLHAFVSSTTSKGNLGGLAGADNTCKNLALAAGLGGTWAAWLSAFGGAGPHAVDRVTSAGPWRLVSGEVVAATKAELASGTLRHAIDHDEKGVLVAPSRVWTGTGPNGLYLTNDCDKWTTGSDGRVGATDSLGATWTSADVDDCDNLRRVYCFQL